LEDGLMPEVKALFNLCIRLRDFLFLIPIFFALQKVLLSLVGFNVLK